jgi:S1-C subfamily serine protease
LGDVLLTVDGRRVEDVDDLWGSLSGDRVAQAVPVKVWRTGQPLDLTVTVGQRP